MPASKQDARRGPGSAKKSSRTSEPGRSTTPSDAPASDDSEAETIIRGSKQNTPVKARQLESDDAASQYTNGDDRTSPDGAIVEDHTPSARKRKAASSGELGTTKSRGLVSKRVRLTQDGEAHDKPVVKSEASEENANGIKPKQDTANPGGHVKDANDETGIRHPKQEPSQSPKQASRNNSHDFGSTSNRASTHEPRTRSSSPSQSGHKRSASLQSATGPADQERRLRSRRGAHETNIPLTQPRLPAASSNSTDPTTPLSANMPRTKDQDRSGRTALFRACEEGQVTRVREILGESKHDIERPDNAKNRPLQAAALLGRTEVVQILVAAGAEVNCFNEAGDTALIDAIDNGHVEVVQKLLESGADPWQKNNEYQLPRDRLEEMDDGPERDAISRLLAEWTDIRSKEEPTKPHKEPERDPHRPGMRKDRIWGDPNIDMMRKAFLYNDNAQISDLLRHSGVVPDNSCAVAAARGGHVKPLEKLVVLDPDPNDVEQTPMLEAIGRGNLEVVDFLLNSEGFNACRIIDGKSYYQLARERKGPRSRTEIRKLKAAYRAYRASKSETEQSKILEPSEDETEDQEDEIEEEETTGAKQGDSSDESVHSPRTGRRRRLVSGGEWAEEQRQKAEDARNSDEIKHNTEAEEEERKRLAAAAAEEAQVEEEKRKAHEAEEAEKARQAAEEAEAKRKAAEEEERKRKQEEEERKRKEEEEAEEKRIAEEEARRKAEEEEEKRRKEEEERRKAAAEEEERRRVEEEERRRAEEAERLRKEEEARRIAEEEETARRKAEEEARRAAEEERARLAAIEAARVAREAYLDSMPRGFRHALQAMGQLKPLRPAGPQYRHMRTFEDWKPIICVGGNELVQCPNEWKDKIWMPNFYASMMLHHERLDECKTKLGWPNVAMTAEERMKLSRDGRLAKSLSMEQNWYNATPEIISQQSPIQVAVYPEERLGGVSKMMEFKGVLQEAREKFNSLPEEQLYWVPLETFVEATTSAKWCAGFKFYTRTGLHVGPPDTYSGALPASVYQDGSVVDHNIQVFQY